MPFERLLVAIDPDREAVLLADRDLAGVQDALRALAEVEQAVAVVIEPAALDERRQVGADLLDVEARDVLRHVRRVRADVADAAGRAALLRVRAPRCLLL
ncbi:MAG TPA: hypothetical protein PLV13_12340, partial [Ilumatobacteraceae bacterium]|nr:hypothetical protein [Ilumatobacteraceae bacterium]